MNNKLIIFAALALASCVGERDYQRPQPKECEVTIAVATADAAIPTTQTRIYYEPANDTDPMASKIASLALFLFDTNTNQLAFHPVAIDPAKMTDGKFTVRLPEGTFNIVALTNHEKTEDYLLQTFPVGTDRDQLLSTFTRTTTGTNTLNNPFPMWGMKRGYTISDNTNITDFTLHRMFARIDVEVTGSDDATGGFRMNEIRYYNTRNMGRMAPEIKNWNFDGKVNGIIACGLASAPSLPDGVGMNAHRDVASAISPDGKKSLAVMYVAEAPRATDPNDPNAMYVLIKGEYNGTAGWYRVDFWANGQYLDILRNYLYKINIEKVSTPGFATPEEATKNPANIKVTVAIWNDFDMGDTVFDGVHFLSINPQDITVPSAQTTKTVSIKTDTGLTLTSADISCDQSWVNIVPLSAPTVQEDKNIYNLHLDIIANHDAAERTALVKVTAGRMSQAIRVVQEKTVPKTVKFASSSVNFSASGETKYINVECTDPATEYYITISGQYANKFDIRNSSGRPIVSGGTLYGSFTLMIKTERNDTRVTYSSLLTLGAKDPNTAANGTMSISQNPKY